MLSYLRVLRTEDGKNLTVLGTAKSFANDSEMVNYCSCRINNNNKLSSDSEQKKHSSVSILIGTEFCIIVTE